MKKLTIILFALSQIAWIIPEDLPPKPYPVATQSFKAAAVGLPSSFDWRDTGYVTPIKDQENCGACWAFSGVAPLEFRLAMMGKKYTDLSEQIVVNYSGKGDCQGGFMTNTAWWLTEVGITIEECLPYYSGYDKEQGACNDWELNVYRATKWDWAYPITDAEVLKQAVYENGLVIALMSVFKDFESYQGGIYQQETGTFSNFHSVVVTGWDDAGEYFIVKNSWGTKWGEDGFGRISYGEIGKPTTNFASTIWWFGEVEFAYPANSAMEASEVVGDVPLEVSFKNMSTGTIDSYLWDFGDGTTSTERNPTHTFDYPDAFTVQLSAINNIDGEDKTTATIRAMPPPDPLVQTKSGGGGGGGGCFITSLH